MRARRTWAFLVASLTAIALAIAGCGDSPDDDGGNGGSANTPSTESAEGSGGYGY